MFREFGEFREVSEVEARKDSLENSPLLQALLRQNAEARRETEEAMLHTQYDTERVLTRQDLELLETVKKSARLLKKRNF
jgi:hypothetical protein